MNWAKIIFCFDAEEQKIYWSTSRFIKINKKLKSLRPELVVVDFSQSVSGVVRYLLERPYYEYELANQNGAIKREVKRSIVMQL